MQEVHRKNQKRITLLIAIQISIILASFLTLQFYESEKIFAGNAVNIAGKNRFLTFMVLNEVKDLHMQGRLIGDPISALGTYEKNLQLLREGGIQKDMQLSPLQNKFEPQWENLYRMFLNYESKVEIFVKSSGTEDREDELVEIAMLADELVELNDVLTSDLALEVQNLTTILIWLQIFLMAVNIAAHIIMIRMIQNILRKETDRLVKMEKLYTVGELAARLAHDLKNPLTVIKMATSMLIKEPQTNEEAQNKYQLINNSVNRMWHQINDVMDFVRAKDLQLEKNSMKDVILSASHTTQIPDNVVLELPENDSHLVCDKQQLIVVISNLISNAVEAIGSDMGRITIRLNEDSRNVSVDVEDSGPGIPDNLLPKIFDILFTTKQRGTGLGLVSCKNIVESHNGTIQVKNNPTTFTITIPKKA